MGLLDLLKFALLGIPDRPPPPAVAEITIISSGPAKPTSESRSVKARD